MLCSVIDYEAESEHTRLVDLQSYTEVVIRLVRTSSTLLSAGNSKVELCVEILISGGAHHQPRIITLLST